MSDPSVQAPSPRAAGTEREISGRFWSKHDLVACVAAALVSFAGYVYTLAPSVTLDDSGELLTAAHHLGVPHPPGYPLWTILAWVWQWIIPFGNIAWRENLLSALFSAMAVGLTTLLISRSGRSFLMRAGFSEIMGRERLQDLVAFGGSVSAGLMLAFSPVMWSEAVATSVHGLNTLLLMATLVVLYHWSCEPETRWRLYLAAFLWGVGLTEHQGLALLAVTFPLLIWLVDRRLGRDVLVPVLTMIAGVIMWMMFAKNSQFHQGSFSAIVFGGIALASAAWLYLLWREGPGLMQRWPQVLLLGLAIILGLALYCYEPLISRTNPPMNWGYTGTSEGFVRHVIEGQHERVHIERTVMQLWGQLNLLFDDLQQQFNCVYALLALVALFFYRDLAKPDRNWMKFLLSAFVFLGLGIILLANPAFGKQKQFVDRVFFLPAHCIYSIWIGYGLMIGLYYFFSQKIPLQGLALPAVIVVLLLPVYPAWRNWTSSERRGHDFGYQFGYLMFKPGGGYPEMETAALLFGSTDPGRFVAAHMVFVESQVPRSAKTHLSQYPDSATFDRRDVSIIAQTALADPAYVEILRDHYGYERGRNDSVVERWLGRNQAYPRERIWIPTPRDTALAFQKYIDELRTRPRLPGEEIKVENGHVSVQGPTSVMAINGYLTRMIFENNKEKHPCYVEEGYPMVWMYPYLEPYGIILKLNKDPVSRLDPVVVARDREYWDALFDRLMSDPKFRRDGEARRMFAKLRIAIGDLYAFRKMVEEAEHALKQAVVLCPDAADASFRLAQFYVDSGQYDRAADVLGNFERLDPYNLTVRKAIKAIENLKTQAGQIHQLEQQHQTEPDNLEVAVQLVAAYAQARRVDAMDALVDSLTLRPDFSSNDLLRVAGFYSQMNRGDRVSTLLSVFVRRFPQSPLGWYDLAVIHSARNECQAAVSALQRALALDGGRGGIRSTARQDPRLNNCRVDPQFQQLVADQPERLPSTLPFTVSH